MQPRLIIFDFDGTLMDSQPLILEAMRAAFSHCGYPQPSDQAIRNVIGLSLHAAMAALLPQTDSKEQHRLAAAYKAAYRDLRENQNRRETLFPEARQTIEMLNAMPDIVLAIATGKSRRGLYGALEREGLRSYFVTLQTADDAPSKPHPAMLHQAMRETGIGPNRTVMIGDATFDMIMANRAGVPAIGVAWGYQRPERLRAAGAWEIAADFTDLCRRIERLRPMVQLAKEA